MAQRLALRRLHQFDKQFALEGKTCVDLLVGRRGNGVDATQRGREILRHRADGIPRELKIGIRIGMSAFQITNQRERPGCRNFVCEGNRTFHQVSRDHAVEQLLSGQTREKLAFYRIATHDDVERCLDPENAWQTLRAARARQ